MVRWPANFTCDLFYAVKITLKCAINTLLVRRVSSFLSLDVHSKDDGVLKN